jgi:UDP-N-acetylglucosamine 2-epimerase (non-hydrolysing)
MAPLVHKLKLEPQIFDVKVCVTAQHRHMLDQALELFKIIPDFDLNIMKPGQDLIGLTTSILHSIGDILKNNQPDLVIVHGDTTTSFVAALASFYCGIPVAHVEAGLRTYDLQAPFPEEFNRQVVSKIAKWHFSPTDLSRSNLISERVNEEKIFVTGNTVIDSLFWVLNRIDSEPERLASLSNILNQCLNFTWQYEKFILITGHRRENFGEGFFQICDALRDLASRYSEVQFVYPVHLNPNVQKPVREILSNFKNVHLIEPLDYEPFLYLLKHSHMVLTDSGGIQEEAPSLGKPVLVMRDVTERPEAVSAGTVELVGANKERIISGVVRLLEDEAHYKKMSQAHNPYGDGNACNLILNVLKKN